MRLILKLWREVNMAAARFVVLALALVVMAGTASASGIMLQIRDLPLKDVVNLLVQQSGANVVIQDDSMLGKKVTVSLNDVSLENALNYVVKSAGVTYCKANDGTFIIGGVLGEEPVIAKVDSASVLPAVSMPPAIRQVEIRVIPLIHSKASDLLRLLGWDGVNPARNCEAVYPEFGEKQWNDNSQSPKGLYIQNSNGQVYSPTNGARIDNGQSIIPTADPTSLSRGGAGRAANTYTGAGQMSDGRPPYVPPNRQTTTTAPPSPGGSSTQGSSDMLMPEGIDQVKPFDLDNSIIVKGTQDGIEEFKKIVRMLDVPPKQVEVKAEFVEVKTTDVKAFGIDWSLQRLNESFATAFGPGGNVIVGLATGNLTASLRTQLTSDVGTIINSPIISTINNQNAQISIQTIIPYWQTMTVQSDVTTDTQSVVNFININTHLDILPRVNGDGTITMMIRPGVSDTGNIVTGPKGETIPEQRTQELFTQRRVANGETIVVGGFIRKNDSNSYQKIPVLGDLPIVGSLFRTVNKQNEDRELLIFITPRIIPEVGGGSGSVDVPIL